MCSFFLFLYIYIFIFPQHVLGAIDRLLWPNARAVKLRQLLMMAYGHGGQLVARLLSKYPKLLQLGPTLHSAASPSVASTLPGGIPTLRALGLIESSHKLRGSTSDAAVRVFFSERTLNWRGGEFLARRSRTTAEDASSPSQSPNLRRGGGAAKDIVGGRITSALPPPQPDFACNSIEVGSADPEHRALAIATCTPAVFIFFEIALRQMVIDVSNAKMTEEGSALGDVLRLRACFFVVVFLVAIHTLLLSMCYCLY